MGDVRSHICCLDRKYFYHYHFWADINILRILDYRLVGDVDLCWLFTENLAFSAGCWPKWIFLKLRILIFLVKEKCHKQSNQVICAPFTSTKQWSTLAGNHLCHFEKHISKKCNNSCSASVSPLSIKES